MDNEGQRTVPKLQRNRAYMVLTYIRSSVHYTNVNMGLLQEHGVYMGFEDAVRELKKVCLTLFEGFLPAVSPEQRDKHPFRNKIGELCESGGSIGWGSIGWGYSWVEINPSLGETMARWMWTEKTFVHRRKGETGKEMSSVPASLSCLKPKAASTMSPLVSVHRSYR
jgi:hypothetical protein